MAKQSELLDRTITYLVTFPVTMLGLLFRPRKTLSTEYEDKRCPPGVTFAFSLIVWFVGNRTMLRILAGEDEIPLVPASDEMARFIVAASAILLVQALLLSALLKNRLSNQDWRILAQYLAYPLAAYFSVVGLVKVLSVHFPGTTNVLSQSIAQLECYFDSEIGDCARWVISETETIYSQAKTVAFPISLIIYLWTLYNVIRVYCGVGFFQGIGMTLTALVLAIIIFLTGSWLINKNQKCIQELSEKYRRPAAEEVISQPNHASPVDIKGGTDD